MDMDKYIGRLLDNRYEILEVLGVGGMAVVYKARCHRLNRLVAIKILKDEYSQDEEFRRRFHAESQAVAMLSHPNIVSVYDVSSSDEADYIVMELIDGITLKQYMEKKGVLNWKETLHFAILISKALEHAHSRGIVHRDIKPHNVMVLKNGSVKVTDFGIARVMSKSNTLTKEALGSVHYISPEQAKGGRVDNRSDIYSLGVVMYEMITGRPPYDGESPVAVAIQHINGGALMPSTLNPNIPGGLEQIIMKAMSHDPADRYPSATAMLHDMDEFRKDPTILFDFNSGGVDDATRIHQTPVAPVAVPAVPKTTAERVAAGSGERNRVHRDASPQRRPAGIPNRGTAPSSAERQRQQQQRRRRELLEEEAEDRRNRITTIAIVACSAVAIIAIGVFLATIFLGWGQGSELVAVPDLRGKNYETLGKYENFVVKLSEKSFNEEFESGRIFKQLPEPGVEVPKGTEIYVYVSTGPKPQDKVMADLVGVDVEQAKAYLIEQGISEASILIRREPNEEYKEGLILKTDPAKDTKLTEGQVVTIWVSSGKEIVTGVMPNVVGWNLERALTLLEANGFKNVEISNVDNNAPAGQVVRQSVDKDTVIDVTTLIIIEVSNGPTEPPTEEPTEPPTEVRVQKTIIIELPGLSDVERLFQLKQGNSIVYETTLQPGQLSLEITLTGSGIQYYDKWIDGVFWEAERVDFTADFNSDE